MRWETARNGGLNLNLARSQSFWPKGVLRQGADFRGHAEKEPHAFEALLVKHVMDVGFEIGANGVFRDRQPRGPLGGQGLDMFPAVIAGAIKSAATVSSKTPAASADAVPQTAETKG